MAWGDHQAGLIQATPFDVLFLPELPMDGNKMIEFYQCRYPTSGGFFLADPRKPRCAIDKPIRRAETQPAR
jgi:hypothetical protein